MMSKREKGKEEAILEGVKRKSTEGNLKGVRSRNDLYGW